MSDTPARHMSKALKRELVPSLNQQGFVGSFPRYRRETSDAIEFLAIWYNKAATAFVVEFGTHARGDKQTSWGETVPETKLILEHVPFNHRLRLQEDCSCGSTPGDWFQFGGLGEDVAAYKGLAQQLRRFFHRLMLGFAPRSSAPIFIAVAPDHALERTVPEEFPVQSYVAARTAS